MIRLQLSGLPGRRRMAIQVLLGCLVLAVSGCEPQSSLERSESHVRRVAWPSPTPLQPFLKTEFDVRFLDGKSEKLSRLLANRKDQGKVVAINFWATWCAPCRREIPVLTALDREYRGRGVEIIGLSVESPDEARELVKAFGEQYSILYPLGFASTEMYQVFSGPGGPEIIPQTFVFGRNGELIMHLRGFQTNFRELIEAAFERGLT
jgi:thiol-disulfide isomerase/thioredoxin